MNTKFIIAFLTLLSLAFLGCSDTVDNSITFQNIASNDVYVSFRGTQTYVPNGATVKITDIDRGEYQYATVYEIPLGSTPKEEGDLSGTFKISAGTKILVIYSSVLEEGTYTIYATVTTSDDQSEDGLINPIFP